MILPDKYTKVNESMICQSAVILNLLGHKKMTFDTIWKKYNKKSPDFSFAYFSCTIEFMYISKMINYSKDGEIFNENIEFENCK